MTRKDFELLAAAIRESRILDAHEATAANQHAFTARCVSAALARTNPRFDAARFLKAAGAASEASYASATRYTAEGAPYSPLGGHGADWGDSLGASPLATKLREYTP